MQKHRSSSSAML